MSGAGSISRPVFSFMVLLNFVCSFHFLFPFRVLKLPGGVGLAMFNGRVRVRVRVRDRCRDRVRV
jgi:hypothetical protein